MVHAVGSTGRSRTRNTVFPPGVFSGEAVAISDVADSRLEKELLPPFASSSRTMVSLQRLASWTEAGMRPSEKAVRRSSGQHQGGGPSHSGGPVPERSSSPSGRLNRQGVRAAPDAYGWFGVPRRTTPPPSRPGRGEGCPEDHHSPRRTRLSRPAGGRPLRSALSEGKFDPGTKAGAGHVEVPLLLKDSLTYSG
jgi:hypothetical protein